MAELHYTMEEIARRGEEIYQQQLRARVEPGNEGKILVLDVDTGDYEIDGDDLAADHRLRSRHPDSVFYGLRIGYPAADKIGGSWGKGHP
jgi:hypothetical protein